MTSKSEMKRINTLKGNVAGDTSEQLPGTRITPKRMDPELKAKWIAALRSGEYQQIRGQLRMTGVGHCCLGVLCDVSCEVVWADDTAIFHAGEGPDEIKEDAELPDHVAECMGVGEAQITLVRMNDGMDEYKDKPQTFAQIAAYIEANL